MSAFLLIALDVPQKTPLLIVTDVQPGPIPQPPWLSEEIERLKLLDSHTLMIRDYTPASSVGSAIADFRRSLHDLAAAADQTGSIIVYVRLPGLVDDAGRPCLILPHVSPFQSEQWLPVESLLDQVAGDAFPAHIRRLVIFDRCQPTCIWPAGSLADTFADRLTVLMKRQQHAGRWQSLAVLSDTSGGQKGWGSPTRGGSVFGDAVWAALIGQADATECGGNGDQQVSISEFAKFVTERTSGWVRANRGQLQTPTLITSTHNDGNLCWAAPRETQQARQAEADRLRTTIDSDTALHGLSNLWKERIALETQTPWQCDPVGWQQLNHLLVNYEQMIAGGCGAARQRDDVERSIRSLLDQLNQSTRFSPPLNPGEARLHHRHLTRRLNRSQTSENERIANLFDQVRQRPSRQFASALLNELHQNGSVPQDWDLIVLQHLIEDGPDAAWARTELISRVLTFMESLGEIHALSEVSVGGMLERQCQPMEADFRAILDRLFVGTDEDLSSASRLLTTAEEKLAECKQSSQRLTGAIHLRDRAAAELPRLAEWIYAPDCRPEPSGRHLLAAWTSAAQSWQQLDQAIAACRTQGGVVKSVALAAALSTQLESELEVLWAQVDQTYDQLLRGAVDAFSVAAMEHMLSTSLLPRKPDSRSRSRTEQRMSLFEIWQEAAAQLDMQYAVSLKSNHPAKSRAAPGPDDGMYQVAHGAAAHPMSFMLSLSEPSTPNSRTDADELLSPSEEQASRIRHVLAGIPQSLHRDHLASFDSPDLRDRAWQTQARQVRNAASWLPGNLPCNPCQQTELAAWGRQLRCRAASFAEDFWSGPPDNGVPFFVRAATDLLDAADLCEASLKPSLTTAGKSEVNAIRQRLTQFPKLDRPGLRVHAVAVPQILPTDDLQTSVSVTRSPDAIIPAGRAAVLIGPPNRSFEAAARRAPVQFRAVPHATEEANTWTVQLPCRMRTTHSDHRPVRALALFRGHRFTDDFQLAPTAGLTVRSIVAAPSPTTVVVQSHRHRPNAILFILDASASMTDNVAREGTRGSVRKLDAAVEALTSLLTDLSDQPDIQVGVALFGHRVAAGETAGAGVMHQPLYLKRFPFSTNLQPYEDVETILRIGRFSVIERGQVADRLRSLRPWGETPLYLSILEALQQFESLRSDVTKTLVVITDGLNYQFNPTPAKRTQLDDVLKTLPGRNVAIHLVGFGIADPQMEQARTEFTRISDATGGSSDITVRDAGRLQTHLRLLCQPARFTVEGRDGFRQTAQVGQPIALPLPAANEEPFDLRFEAANSRISISGGEKLTFRPAEDGTLQIVTELPERSAALHDYASGQSSRCELTTSRPVWNGDDLHIRWSLRQRDGQFTPRPAIGCFRVQPLDASGVEIGTAAVCVGPADLPGQPLPTWEYQIPHWPRAAVTARVQGWVTTAPTSAESSELCATLLQKQDANESWQAMSIPSIFWQIRHGGSSITLVERYDTAAAEPKVWSNLHQDRSQPSPALVNVERRFDAEHRLFVQTWYFERDLSNTDLASLRFHFTRLEQLRAHGWDMTSALLVPIVSETLVIQPVPVMTR